MKKSLNCLDSLDSNLMTIIDSLSLQLTQKVPNIEILQGQLFLVIFICGVELDDQLVIHIEDLWVVIELLA